jgi:hypothetical protein
MIINSHIVPSTKSGSFVKDPYEDAATSTKNGRSILVAADTKYMDSVLRYPKRAICKALYIESSYKYQG